MYASLMVRVPTADALWWVFWMLFILLVVYFHLFVYDILLVVWLDGGEVAWMVVCKEEPILEYRLEVSS